MEVIAVRPLTIAGKTYAPGEPVVGLSEEKKSQLVAQRYLRTKDEGPREYVALRRFSVGTKVYERGVKLKITKMAQTKLNQLLEQRYLEPAPKK